MLMQMMNIFIIKPAEDAMEVCVLYNSCALNDTFGDDEGRRTQRIRPSLPAKTSSRDQVVGQSRAGAANNIRIVHITDIHVEESYLEVHTLIFIQQIKLTINPIICTFSFCKQNLTIVKQCHVVNVFQGSVTDCGLYVCCLETNVGNVSMQN